MTNTPASLLQRLREQPTPDDWERFDAQYRPFLQRLLQSRGIQTAEVEDLVQEVLTTWVAEVRKFERKRDGSLRAWLATVARHRFLTLVRDRKRWPQQGDLEKFFDQIANPEADLSRFWNREHDDTVLQATLARIRPDFEPTTWRAFEMVCVQGMKPAQAAKELGATPNSVWIAKHRVLKRLRQETEGMIEE
ncbi:MAG: RNA polymerase sigma factor [Planctomycetes bacterium]|nr:RNA polymerase sigma factor [Planctomycetota bacterium]